MSLRIAVIEAEALGKRALGNEYNKYSQAAPARVGIYSGEIVAENAEFVVQKVTPLETVRHLKDRLLDVPHVGETVRVSYRGGLGLVSPKV